jgi:MFS transporter, DHA1 family, tetracycline resistance protein
MMLLGVWQGLLSPSVTGLLSRLTPMSRQGAVFGTLTSAQTLARMISYSASNVLLGKVSTAAPYWGAFGAELVAIAVASRSAARLVAEKPLGDSVTDVRTTEQVGIDHDL